MWSPPRDSTNANTDVKGNTPGSAACARSRLPSAVAHTRTQPSSPPVNSSVPSAENWQWLTGAASFASHRSVWHARPVTSHTFTVRSCEMDASAFPSGVNASAVTQSVCG